MIQMIRQCIGPKQKDWASKLAAVEFALNSARSETTGFAPFFLNYGRMPRSFIWNHADKNEFPGVRVFATRIRNAIMAAHDSILAARVKQTRNANRRRQTAPFQLGDLVYLSTENIRFEKGLARKFLPRYIGPYKIIRDFGNFSFQIELPPRLKQRGVHDVFHASKLRIHVPNDDRLFPGRSDDQIWEYDGEGVESEFTVDKILNHTGSGSNAKFEILWRDGDKTWLSYHKISHLTALRDYLEAMGAKDISELRDNERMNIGITSSITMFPSLQSPNDMPIIAPSVTVLRFNANKQMFTLKPPPSVHHPTPMVLYFSIDEVYSFMYTNLNMVADPKRWENKVTDAGLPKRYIEFAQNFNKDRRCPAKFCQRIAGTLIVPPTPVDWKIINLAPLMNGAYQSRGTPTTTPASNPTLTAGPSPVQSSSRSTDDNSRAMAIVLRERELQLEQLECSIKEHNQRGWHVERRLRQRPSPMSPYPPQSHPSPRSLENLRRARSERRRDLKRAPPLSKVSSRRTFNAAPLSTSNGAPSVSPSTSRNAGETSLLFPESSNITPTPATSVTSAILLPSSVSSTQPVVSAMNSQEPQTAEISEIPFDQEDLNALTLTSGLGEDLEVNLTLFGDSGIDDFFRETIEGATQRTPTSPRPSTHEVLKNLSFKKNAAAPAAPNPSVEDDFIPENLDDIDMGDADAEGSPEPESVIITV
ncbi:hypothetical protein NMY22_g7694 [Coprinellus aureogranulatus]|nr:hypothetical protein NMY22_g7694 [Coprinellus aureogranulatus]